jgi:hypothetical protein
LITPEASPSVILEQSSGALRCKRLLLSTEPCDSFGHLKAHFDVFVRLRIVTAVERGPKTTDNPEPRAKVASLSANQPVPSAKTREPLFRILDAFRMARNYKNREAESEPGISSLSLGRQDGWLAVALSQGSSVANAMKASGKNEVNDRIDRGRQEMGWQICQEEGSRELC